MINRIIAKYSLIFNKKTMVAKTSKEFFHNPNLKRNRVTVPYINIMNDEKIFESIFVFQKQTVRQNQIMMFKGHLETFISPT